MLFSLQDMVLSTYNFIYFKGTRSYKLPPSIQILYLSLFIYSFGWMSCQDFLESCNINTVVLKLGFCDLNNLERF